MFKTTARSFYFPSFSAVTVNLQAAGETKRRPMNCLLLLKIPSQQLLQLTVLSGSRSFPKPAGEKSMQISARKQRASPPPQTDLDEGEASASWAFLCSWVSGRPDSSQGLPGTPSHKPPGPARDQKCTRSRPTAHGVAAPTFSLNKEKAISLSPLLKLGNVCRGAGREEPGLFAGTALGARSSTCLPTCPRRSPSRKDGNTPRESLQGLSELFTSPPRIPDNRAEGKLGGRQTRGAGLPRKALETGQGELGCSHPFPTPGRPHRDTPGCTSPPHSHPSVRNAHPQSARALTFLPRRPRFPATRASSPRSRRGLRRRLRPTSNFASPPGQPEAPCHPAAGRRAREGGGAATA